MDGLFGPVHRNATSMGDIDTNLFQPQETHNDVNNTVAQQAGAENRTRHIQNNNTVHTMNCREWTNEEKRRVVQIDAEERQKSRNLMKKIKER